MNVYLDLVFLVELKTVNLKNKLFPHNFMFGNWAQSYTEDDSTM